MGGGRPIAGFQALGLQDFSAGDARRAVAQFDFMITVGRRDANPTTVLEAMAWGLVPICTPQSGYQDHPGITNILVMGPWSHGGWTGTGDALGPVRFQAKTGVFFRENIELPFFEYHLKGKGEFKHPEAWVFEMGTNQWRKHDAWPPRNARPKYLYFQAGGQLSPQVPPSGKAAEMCDEYISDPARPVPFQDRIAAVM